MTTHRIDTLAFVGDKNDQDNDMGIFIIKKDKKDIASIHPTNRLHALFKLTPNLREIANVYFKVYTESFDDATFYWHVYEHLLRLSEAKRKACAASPDGPQSQKILSRRFQLSFYSVAMDHFGGGGGCAAVIKAVQIETLALDNIANHAGTKSLTDRRIDYPFGILDADTKLVKGQAAKQTKPPSHIERVLEEEIRPRQLVDLQRHSLESYVYDPILLCSLLDPNEIVEWISDDEFKKYMLNCHSLLTKPYNLSSQQAVETAFNNYFRYFLEKFILKQISNDAPQYLLKYGYLNPKRDINNIPPFVDVLATLREDLGLPVNSEASVIVERLLQTQVKAIPIFPAKDTPSYTVQYPGFFIYMRGHNIEKFFQTTFFNQHCPQFDPKQPEFNEALCMQFRKKPSFKELLIYKIRNTSTICLPMDLVETFLELNNKVKNQANAFVKPKKTF